jgi:hypothetical protein
MSNTVPRNFTLSGGERINDRSLGKTFIPVNRDERRHPQDRQVFKITSRIVAGHLWSTMVPEFPGLPQCRKVKRLCDPCGAFQAGHLAPIAR